LRKLIPLKLKGDPMIALAMKLALATKKMC
jgi:hypothetical protein